MAAKEIVKAFLGLFMDLLALLGVDAEIIAEIEETLASFDKE